MGEGSTILSLNLHVEELQEGREGSQLVQEEAVVPRPVQDITFIITVPKDTWRGPREKHTDEGGSASEPLEPTVPPQAGASLHQPCPTPPDSRSGHGGRVLTLCQVQDGPCHPEPLVPVDHLQPIQQVHDVGLLLSPVQLQPPPVRHCKRDKTSSQVLPWGSRPCPEPRGAEARAGTLSVKILLETSPVVAQLGLLGVAVEL